MDQKNIAGIGNVYIQDILFAAGLHPLRKTADCRRAERRMLYDAIRSQLRNALELGGLAYEKDLYNQPGRFKDFLVGYREGQAVPRLWHPHSEDPDRQHVVIHLPALPDVA